VYMPRHCYLITYFLQYSLLSMNFLRTIRSFVDNRGTLTDANEITPESNYVFIYQNGTCIWEPRYELSVTQCHVDVKWFPIDRQVCDLEFESWLLNKNSLNLITDNDSVDMRSFLPADGWHLTGTFCCSTEKAGTEKEISITNIHTRTHARTRFHISC